MNVNVQISNAQGKTKFVVVRQMPHDAKVKIGQSAATLGHKGFRVVSIEPIE